MIEIHRSKDDQFYFNVVANNGEIVATSEMYTTKANARMGVEALWSALRCDVEDISDITLEDVAGDSED